MSVFQKIIKYLAIALAFGIIMEIMLGISSLIGIMDGVIQTESNGNGLDIKKYDNTSNILSIDIRASKLVIKDGTSLKVEHNNKYITSVIDNNKVSVTEKVHHSFRKSSNSEVIVYVPRDMLFDQVYIKTGAGGVWIENLNVKTIEFSLGAGMVAIDKLMVRDEARMESGVGEVVIDNASINNLDLEIGVGKFTLNSSLMGMSKIEAGIGEVNINLLGSKENYSVSVEKGLGSIFLDGREWMDGSVYGQGTNKIEIAGGIGQIKIGFFE